MLPTRVFGAGGMDVNLMESALYSGMGKTLLQMCTDVQAIPGLTTMEEAAAASSRTPCQANEPHHSYLTFQVEELVRVKLVVIYTFGLYSPPSPPLPTAPPPSLSPLPPPNPPPKPLYSPPAWNAYGTDAKLCVRGARCTSYNIPFGEVSNTGLYAANPSECARGTLRVMNAPGHSYQNTFSFPIMFASEQGFNTYPPIPAYNPQTQTIVSDAPNGMWCLVGLNSCVLTPDPDYNVFTHTSLECSVLQWCTERRGDDTCVIDNVNQARNGRCECALRPALKRTPALVSSRCCVLRPRWRVGLYRGDLCTRQVCDSNC